MSSAHRGGGVGGWWDYTPNTTSKVIHRTAMYNIAPTYVHRAILPVRWASRLTRNSKTKHLHTPVTYI